MFNLESFDIKLDTDVIGRNFIYTEEADSTNTALLDKSAKFNEHGTVFFAEKQLKGKGRKDRVWYSAKDQNLTFSILLTDNKYFKRNLNFINFAASLAVAISIENLYQLNIDLKWPNDILISGKKTAGILLESQSQANVIERLVIGIGVNVNQTTFQGNFNIAPTSIRLELNEIVERERLLAEILNNLEQNLKTVLKNPKWILKEWKLRCRMIGEKISISENDKSKYGIFHDIDDDGFLLLRNGDKIEKIYFGDINIVL